MKMNFKGMHEDFKCKMCNEENENQKHVIECKILNKDETQMTKFMMEALSFRQNSNCDHKSK